MNLLDPNLDELLNVAIDARRKQEREDALDEPAERLRDLLERKYASWLKANKEVTPELDAVLLAEFRKFSEWSGKSGPLAITAAEKCVRRDLSRSQTRGGCRMPS